MGGPTGGAVLGAARVVRLGFPWGGTGMAVAGLRPEAAGGVQNPGKARGWCLVVLARVVARGGGWPRVVRGWERGGPHVSFLHVRVRGPRRQRIGRRVARPRPLPEVDEPCDIQIGRGCPQGW